MDYEKLVFTSKTEISHFVSESYEEQRTSSSASENFLHQLDAYASYADNFDLSLLPNEIELPSRPAQSASPCNASLDCIPATIFHDRDNNTVADALQIKTELNWCEHHNSTSTLLNQFPKQHQYPIYPAQVYPSPQSSPSQNDNSQLCVLQGTISNSEKPYLPLSPCASIITNQIAIKQELHILPPSPPESNCEALSPHSFAGEIKSEPLDSDVEKLIDITSFLEKSLKELDKTIKSPLGASQSQQDHQLLREYLEDTTFQKKHNLKPLALESLIGGLGVRGDIEPVISLALAHVKRDAEETCIKLQISPDPKKWSPAQVQSWIRSTIEQFHLPTIIDLEVKFSEDGMTLTSLTEEEFVRRAPEVGATIHAQLEIWKLAYSDNFNFMMMIGDHRDIPPLTEVRNDPWNVHDLHSDYMEVNDSDDDFDETQQIDMKSKSDQSDVVQNKFQDNTPTSNKSNSASTRTGVSSHIHLWQFLKELLASPQINGTAIRWIDRSKGVFKIEDSVRVAKLWGRRKNRPAMNYDKLSRSIRQYYKKGIMKKTERSQRLVYQFCHPYSL